MSFTVTDAIGRTPTPRQARRLARDLRLVLDALGPQDGPDGAVARRLRDAADELDAIALAE